MPMDRQDVDGAMTRLRVGIDESRARLRSTNAIDVMALEMVTDVDTVLVALSEARSEQGRRDKAWGTERRGLLTRIEELTEDKLKAEAEVKRLQISVRSVCRMLSTSLWEEP